MIPEYCRAVAAFLGIASDAFAAVPHGWTQGTHGAMPADEFDGDEEMVKLELDPFG